MSLQLETQEALCSALYNMPFAEFLGEQDIDGEHVAYFHIGESPKDMRVSIARPDKAEEVILRLEWRNYSADARNPLKAVQTLRISTYAVTQAQLQHPTTAAVLRILEVYKDILEESGVAGKIEELAPVADSEEATDTE